jgi:hypothetical protein
LDSPFLKRTSGIRLRWAKRSIARRYEARSLTLAAPSDPRDWSSRSGSGRRGCAPRPPPGQLVDQVQRVTYRPAEAIEGVHDDHVALTRVLPGPRAAPAGPPSRRTSCRRRSAHERSRPRAAPRSGGRGPAWRSTRAHTRAPRARTYRRSRTHGQTGTAFRDQPSGRAGPCARGGRARTPQGVPVPRKWNAASLRRGARSKQSRKGLPLAAAESSSLSEIALGLPGWRVARRVRVWGW